MVICKIDNTKHNSYRSLSVYLKSEYGLNDILTLP